MTASPVLPVAGPADRGNPRLEALLWSGFALICLFYAVMAADYFISFAAGREGLWLRLMVWLVSEDYALGAGSVHRLQAAAYTAGLPFMLMHTTLAAVSMALGPFQFSRGLRARRPSLHRAMGKIYLLAELFSMSGGMIYLAITGLHGVYTGAPFALGLWGLNAMVLWTGWHAYRAIRAGEVAQHRAWLAYNFGLLLTAPGLRILWVIYGVALPGWTQAATNLAITTFLLPWCALVGLLWLTAEQWRQPGTGVPLHAPTLVAALRALGVVTALLVIEQWVLGGPVTVALLGAYGSAGALAHEATVRVVTRLSFAIYALALAGVLWEGPALLGDPARLRRSLRRYLLLAAVAALGGIVSGTLLGTAAAGGASMPSYWWGLGVLWLLGLGLAATAAAREHWTLVQQWVVLSQGMALAPLVWFVSAPLARHLLGLEADEAWLTGAIAGFAVMFLLAHALNVRGMGRTAPRAVMPAMPPGH